MSNIFIQSSFPVVLRSPINAGAFCMIAGLVIVPVVSLLTKPLSEDHLNSVFSCYDQKVTVNVTDSIGNHAEN